MKTIGDDFERTSCDCASCRVPCRHMPGCLVPGDLENIAEHQGQAEKKNWKARLEWLTESFRASDGAKVIFRGMVMQVPTLVPAQKEDGSCVFLNEEGHCSIHSVAPFGCAYHDTHMDLKDANERSNAAVLSQMADIEQEGILAHTIATFRSVGLIAPPIEERRKNFEDDLAKVEEQCDQSA